MTSTMTDSTVLRRTSDADSAGSARWLLRDLQQPRDVLSHITPNWYASIMGTGIIAVAAASLPLQFPGFRVAATLVWALAAVLFIALTVVTALHWRTHPDTARGHLSHPVMANFYGAPPMAMLTVGAGTLLLGKDVIGLPLALGIDWVLWIVGTVAGLGCAVVVPYLLITRRRLTPADAFGGWLMPVVPPMVSASTGALLLPYAPEDLQGAMLLCCYAMFAASLLASAVVITMIWRKLTAHGAGPAATVPTLWIVLGPLGQSVTAVNLLGGVAHEAVAESTASVLHLFGILYGVTVLSLAALWACWAAAITVRTARAGLPFSLTWWSFTFPVGTCVTGSTALAVATGWETPAVASVLLYVCLLVAWSVVATRTAHGSLRGRLFLPATIR